MGYSLAENRQKRSPRAETRGRSSEAMISGFEFEYKLRDLAEGVTTALGV